MAKALLYIRLRQFKSEAKGLGLYLVIFIASVLILSIVTYFQYKNNNRAWYVVGVLSITCLAISSLINHSSNYF